MRSETYEQLLLRREVVLAALTARVLLSAVDAVVQDTIAVRQRVRAERQAQAADREPLLVFNGAVRKAERERRERRRKGGSESEMKGDRKGDRERARTHTASTVHE